MTYPCNETLAINISPLTSAEFEKFRVLIYQHAGIDLTPAKHPMVANRLAKRLTHYNLKTYTDYYQLATHTDHTNEFQTLVNILSTNETYFFREAQHFSYLKNEILARWKGNNFRVWSAASSSGEEAYSLAMVLADTLGSRQWKVYGTDVSTTVLKVAEQAIYPMNRLDNMPASFLEKYAEKGVHSQRGHFRINEELRHKVSFGEANLMQAIPPHLNKFDVIFLRNILIYFDNETKKSVLNRVVQTLNIGGHLFVSHTENIASLVVGLEKVSPSVFIKK